jgi:hypothetical protein
MVKSVSSEVSAVFPLSRKKTQPKEIRMTDFSAYITAAVRAYHRRFGQNAVRPSATVDVITMHPREVWGVLLHTPRGRSICTYRINGNGTLSFAGA